MIGIGAGDPALMTMQAAEAVAALDVVLLVDKGEHGQDLADVRQEILRRHGRRPPARSIELRDGTRDPALAYDEAVARWHGERVVAFERALRDEVADGETAGILVWGDPSLYDSTLRIVDQVVERGNVDVQHTVIPGVSSLQLLAARHRIPLNRIGRAVHITTGRLLRQGLPPGVDDAVVMLDAAVSFTTLVGEGFEIFWGASLGTPDELLVAGPLDDVADQIVALRAQARARLGWVFDIYLLRRLERA
ncbi:MAG: precorrin synthase [Ilumatobacteraceae bacterium]|nr:precorrin synthase [Ilumatobacteraceae bacterium]